MYSIYVLGAGFSHTAGLPLGDQLFSLVVQEAKNSVLYENILKGDIESFIDYKKNTAGEQLEEDEINFEEFASYLDIQHLLYLRGSDTWSPEGNRSQIVIRNLIGLILHRLESSIEPSVFDLYKAFASKLDPTDYVLTFNYDTLLERALDSIKKQYRLFPTRFKRVTSSGSGIVDDERREVCILKLHGSIDWFDVTQYENSVAFFKTSKNYQRPRHLIFNNQDRFFPEKIIDEPYYVDSRLQKIYRVKNLDEYYASTYLQ